jgi:hypothetical protein
VPTLAARLAIDLTGSVIRVVDGAMGGPMRCGSGGTPAGSLVDGKVVDVTGVGSALRQLLARTEIDNTQALIAASDSVATFRVLKLPFSASDQEVDAAVAHELHLDPQRMSTQWIDVVAGHGNRVVYAVTWDRSMIKNIVDAARHAGLDPVAVDLKSACVARAIGDAACVIVDVDSRPCEIVLIDGHVPQVWHSFHLDAGAGEDIGPGLTGPLRTLLRFYERRRDTTFDPGARILIAGEQVLSLRATRALQKELGHRVEALPIPARVPEDLRYANYLTCLGLLMRRSA